MDRSVTFRRILQAMRRRAPIKALYDGCVRDLCVHKIGLNAKGEEQALAVQFFGWSSSGPVSPPGEWKCLRLDKLTEVEVMDGDTWFTLPTYGGVSHCVTSIDYEVPYA